MLPLLGSISYSIHSSFFSFAMKPSFQDLDFLPRKKQCGKMDSCLRNYSIAIGAKVVLVSKACQ